MEQLWNTQMSHCRLITHMEPHSIFNCASILIGPHFLVNYHPVFSLFRVQHPRRFSKCSIADYKEFLLKGGGSCLFNRPTKVKCLQLCPCLLHATTIMNHTPHCNVLHTFLASSCSCLSQQNVVMEL